MTTTLLLALFACSLPSEVTLDKGADADTDTDTDTDTDSDTDADTDTDTDADTDADTDTDTDTDTDVDCEASFAVTLPDGSTTTLGCTSAEAEASFEFDPDDPPAVRSLGLRFAAGESATSDCFLDFDLQGVCGAGWYAFDGAASGSVATLDCSGVADEVERIYALTGGAVYLTEISGGDAPGEPGGPVDLVAVGSISARSADGMTITGTFAVNQAVAAVDVEGGECLVETTDPALVDRDLDGVEGPTGTGEDCDDTDATVYPGAYDRPDDGVDGDCDGSDRTFDGVVVDAGGVTTTTVDYVAGGATGLDIALVLDTTCSMGSSISSLDVATIAAAAPSAGDARWSFATYDDYAYGSYGSAGSDLPFELLAQMTDDLTDVQAAIDATGTHSGADGPESGMEALYQALTGAGYDQDCDETYDSSTDVPPFIASSDDPFGGGAEESYDADASGTGDNGGVGFRDHSQPVVVLITDNYMRDPDASYGTPGGCPDDAGSVAVAEAATEQNAWIVGILVNGTLAASQFSALASATGHYVDSDGDGVADDAPTYTSTGSGINAEIAAALEDVAAAAEFSGAAFAELEIVVGNDPYGIVDTVTPSSFTGVTPGDPLSFEVSFVGIETDVALTTTIALLVFGDGELIDTIEVEVEIAPS